MRQILHVNTQRTGVYVAAEDVTCFSAGGRERVFFLIVYSRENVARTWKESQNIPRCRQGGWALISPSRFLCRWETGEFSQYVAEFLQLLQREMTTEGVSLVGDALGVCEGILGLFQMLRELYGCWTLNATD
ncbi:hypothetical protein AVEN_59235-1 [Araneus ventricosus]|uniref:Uncharacterized protein n=1 Tax=Araneus ventricosus TaxID=182803 RepID=A0A4Y2D133_ARAVE|nr:hypothetical protein AVEN_59235-1 [Araneus ventricosus]